MKRLLEYCKPGVAERVLFLSPVALMILCDFIMWCEDHGLPCVISAAVSTEEEDIALKRTSESHLRGRAFDASVRGWGDIQKKSCIQYFSEKYEGYAAIGASGALRLVYLHDAGTGEHLHFQVAKKFSMPVI